MAENENIRTSGGKKDTNDNKQIDNQSKKQDKPEKGSKWT